MRSTLKRPSLGRLLASLRPPPSRAGSQSSFPVQTGFPTSLADLVVKNHGRLIRPRKQRSPTAALAPRPSPPQVALTVAAEEVPLPAPTQPISPVTVRRLDASPRAPRGGACFRLVPELLAAGGAVSLALLAVWSEGTVAAFTVAALSLLWIESATRRRRRPTETNQTMALVLDSCGRGPVSPIREVEEAPSSGCSDSDKGDELVAGDGGGASDDATTPKRKAKRSLKKLISKKLQKKPKPKYHLCSEAEGGGSGIADQVLKTESWVTASESSTEWSSFSSSSSEPVVAVLDGRGPGGRFPLGAWALAPLILAGLFVGKLPATALAVLCIIFSSVVQRL